MKLTTREKLLSIIAAAVVLGGLLYAAALEPAIGRYQHEGILLAERARRISVLQKEIAQEKEINRKYDAAMRRIASDSKKHVSAQQLFYKIQNLSAPSGVKIKGVTPLPVEKHVYYDNAAIRVDIESDLQSLVLFLSQLQLRSNTLDVQRVTVAPREPGKPTLASEVQISTAIFHPEAITQ